jgi:hypothetical protein
MPPPAATIAAVVSTPAPVAATPTPTPTPTPIPSSSAPAFDTATKDWLDASPNRLDIESMVSSAVVAKGDSSQCGQVEATVANAESDLPTPDAKLASYLKTTGDAYVRAAQACMFQDTATATKYFKKGDAAERKAEQRAKALHGHL